MSFVSSVFRTPAVLAAAAALTLGLAGAVPAAAVTPAGTAAAPAAAAAAPPAAGSVPPDQDPFYAAPADIAAYAPGAVVGSRPVTITDSGVAGRVRSWQISYRSNDSHGKAELAVTTLLVPTAAWTGTGARPAVSVQEPEDSTGTQCAPSYAMLGGGSGPLEYTALISPLVDRGWAVAVPDFEGPKAEFMTGLQAGHAALDGIRAVRAFRGSGLTKASPWALYGYSGGGEATGWTAQLQPSYAPELHLVGVAMGGTPSDPAAVARSLDGGIFSGFEAAAAVSIDVEYPEANLDSLLNAQGVALKTQAQGKCLTDLLTAFPFKKLSDYTTVPDPLSVPSVAAVLRQNTLGAATPTAPVYDYHATGDEIVPVAQDDALVDAWCALGGTVQKVRDDGGEHAIELLVRQDSALGFLSDRFAGTPPTSTC